MADAVSSGVRSCTTRLSGMAVSALVAVYGTACGTAERGGRATVEIPSQPSCTDCTIRVTRTTTLGHLTDPVSPDTWAELARDSRGRYYVAPTAAKSGIAVYDSAGQFIRTIGRSGKEPGEFQLIRSVTVGPNDTLFVLDLALHRLTVLSPSYDVVRTVPVAKAGFNLTILADGRLLVGSLSPFPGPSAGEPVHLLSKTGELVRSFGVESPDLTREGFDTNRRTFTLASDDAVWVAPPSRYELELWGLDGTKRRTLARSVDWFPPWTDTHQQPIDVAPPSTALIGIRQDDEGRLWVFLSVADENWRSGRTVSEPRGVHDAPAVLAPDASRYLDTIIEVLDPGRGRLITSSRVPVSLQGLLDDDLAYSRRSDAAGYNSVDIWRLQLTGAPNP